MGPLSSADPQSTEFAPPSTLGDIGGLSVVIGSCAVKNVVCCYFVVLAKVHLAPIRLASGGLPGVT